LALGELSGTLLLADLTADSRRGIADFDLSPVLSNLVITLGSSLDMISKFLNRAVVLSGALLLISAVAPIAQAKDVLKGSDPAKTAPSPAPKTAPSPAPKMAPAPANIMEQLKLTEDQKKKIAVIRGQRTKAIKLVLTDKQKTDFDKAREKQTVSQALKSLGLNKDQVAKIQAISKKSADDIMGVLDKTQKTTLTDYLKKNSGQSAE
jgi:Spy/CpxP family protein refolding chaperone